MVSSNMVSLLKTSGVNVTFQSRAEGTRSPITGWPVISYSSTTGYIIYDVIGSRNRVAFGENITERRLKMFSTTGFTVLDRITIGAEEYEVEVEPETLYFNGAVSHYTTTLLKRE